MKPRVAPTLAITTCKSGGQGGKKEQDRLGLAEMQCKAQAFPVAAFSADLNAALRVHKSP